jgi:hypothetical protein
MGRDLKPPRLAGDKAVAANAMFTRVDPGDVGRVTEPEVVHVNALASRRQEGEPQ